ncbi:SDR family NAD(P)-dependent oxidoreductase [Amycolatopsis sp. La24]|uniref:SDR family NAD(P)-dependent oxidoreductase n=1 Tax=Amycolatopsis sp. La24 TaxID=3028304 RepID=UPI0023B023C2|nr:SDR family NAD(P)-dependent oxidoreductase [Amycolatopsis sp. La24]
MRITNAGRTALVTGGARGIGAAIAEAFANTGARVIVVDVAGAADCAESLAARSGSDVQALVLDVISEERIASAFGAVGRIDILVNNAGISRPAATTETARKMWDEVLAVNLTAAFLCAKHALPGMREAGWGRIVSIASFAAKSSPIYGDNASYAASKAGLLGLTRNLAVEHGSRGITANAIAPGIVDTELLRSAHSPQRRAELLAKLPTGAFTTPEQVAGLAVFLASDIAGSVTGEVVNINGGLYFD